MQRTDHRSAPSVTAAGELHRWLAALATVVAALAAMAVVAALGLWLAGANGLPGGGFGAVVAATVLMALGVPTQLEGSAVFVATAQGGITALPLSVTLVGALTAGAVFLRPLRLHAVVGGRDLAGRVLRTAALWVVAVVLVSLGAQHSFTVSTGEDLLDEIGGLIGGAPEVGFKVEPGAAAGLGLVWLLVVLALALAVSRRTPLPARLLRFHSAVRPAAHAVLTLLLAYVVLALVIGVLAVFVHGSPRETLAVITLALPNLAWIALGVGLGGSWHGHVTDTIGLPMPEPLAAVLRSNQDVTLDLGSLAEQDGHAWLLLPLAAVAVLLTGVGMALHTRPGTAPWRHALHLAVALAVAMLLVGLVTRISAAFGLALLGMGGRGATELWPNLLVLVALGVGWGAVGGFLGGLVATRVRRPGTP
ncbi:streptophobe family protein [Kitasatospora sp. NPDC048540]|uniref:streptophobe family protein n=1 Tax=unclassified Kitasatospora TaxID=2633591 RepID=UPI0005397DBD|nr:streptophobe family protein [Kitasatospora sp. MBT63]